MTQSSNPPNASASSASDEAPGHFYEDFWVYCRCFERGCIHQKEAVEWYAAQQRSSASTTAQVTPALFVIPPSSTPTLISFGTYRGTDVGIIATSGLVEQDQANTAVPLAPVPIPQTTSSSPPPLPVYCFKSRINDELYLPSSSSDPDPDFTVSRPDMPIQVRQDEQDETLRRRHRLWAQEAERERAQRGHDERRDSKSAAWTMQRPE